MGYYVHQSDTKFHIKRENIKPAFDELKIIKEPLAWASGLFSSGFKNLTDALEDVGWILEFDNATGDVVGISFESEKIGDEQIFFSAIAPYVTKGSFIEMCGEDGERWRWVFDGKTMKEVYPKVLW